jgi:hypothetical protein
MPLRKLSTLTLLKCSHFGRALIVQVYVHFLLTKSHGGYLWLDQLDLIDETMIHRVSSLPTFDKDPTDTLKKKDAAQEEVYSRFGTRRRKHKVVIPKITNLTILFTTQLLACKLIHKCRKREMHFGSDPHNGTMCARISVTQDSDKEFHHS